MQSDICEICLYYFLYLIIKLFNVRADKKAKIHKFRL